VSFLEELVGVRQAGKQKERQTDRYTDSLGFIEAVGMQSTLI